MKHPVLVAAASLVVGLGLAQRCPADAMDKSAFGEFLAKMQAAAQTAKLTDPNDPLFYSLRDQSYKEEALEPLKSALAALPVNETGIFTAGRILIPLVSSDVEVVRKAIPTVAAAQGRLVKYLPLPSFSKEELRSMNLPAAPDPRANAEMTLRVLSDFAERRQKRLDAEAKVIRMNTQSMILEKVIWEVMLRAGKNPEDDSVLAAVSRAEQDKRITYKHALDVIVAHASRMDQPRATRFYKALEKVGTALQLMEGNYISPGAVIFGTQENTVFHTPHCYPGVDMLKAANALAPVAKQPVLKVPTPVDISGNKLLNEAKTLLASNKGGERDQGKGLLDRVLTECAGTAAAEEAKRILEALANSLLQEAKNSAAPGMPLTSDAAKGLLDKVLKDFPGTNAAAEARKLRAGAARKP